MSGIYNLYRFLTAQAPIYNTVLAELRAGRKSSHWIWFIFPQITGLGHSGTAQQFAIGSLDEARDKTVEASIDNEAVTGAASHESAAHL